MPNQQDLDDIEYSLAQFNKQNKANITSLEETVTRLTAELKHEKEAYNMIEEERDILKVDLADLLHEIRRYRDRFPELETLLQQNTNLKGLIL